MSSHAQKIHRRAGQQLREKKKEELLDKITNSGVLGPMKVEDLNDTLIQLIELGATKEEINKAFQEADAEHRKIHKSPLVINPDWDKWTIMQKKEGKNQKKKKTKK